MQVTINGKKVVLVRFRQSVAAAVNAGVTVQTMITPNAGKIARVRYAGAFVPAIATATSGDHRVYVTCGIDTTYGAERAFDSAAVAFGTVINLDKSNYNVALDDLIFDSNNPLTFTYWNNTNANQTGTRFYFVVYEEEAIA